MSVGFIIFVITSILLGTTTGRPKRHSKRILSPLDIEEFAKPRSSVFQPEDVIKPVSNTRISGDYHHQIKVNKDHQIKVNKDHIDNISDTDSSVEDNKTTEEETVHQQIPFKGGLIEEETDKSGPVTHWPGHRRGPHTTSGYYTQSTGALGSTTPPWHQQYKQYIDLIDIKQDAKFNHFGGTLASEEATSTTPDYSKCHCDFIEHDKLYKYLVNADNNGYDSIPYYDRLELLQMGLYTTEQAKRCYHYCRHRTPTMSQSYSSQNAATYVPGRQNEIEIVTDSVDPDAMSMIRGRQHCYQTLKDRNWTVNDSGLCYDYYKPTHDSPQPSTKPRGLHVWTCCRTITPRGYY